MPQSKKVTVVSQLAFTAITRSCCMLAFIEAPMNGEVFWKTCSPSASFGMSVLQFAETTVNFV